MLKKISLFFFGFGIIFIPLNALAYNNITTHPALTSEMVKLHNNFSEKKINNEEKQWMMDGSREEDMPVTRTLNHFYDPIYQRGLSGDINAEELAPFIKILKPMILSAKDWAQDSYAQATFLAEAYKNAALNPYAQSTKSAVEILTTHTWEKAINSYINGDKQEAFRNLGHVLHLIEDMAVPAHVRNDHHMRGDIYEIWTTQFGPNNIDVVSQLSGRRPLKFNSLNQYFDYLATYTNTHFYSQDTIGIQMGYNQPEWNYLNTKIFDGYEYSINEDDFGEYFLVKKKGMKSVMISLSQNITIDDDLIYSDYWSHLSKQAVLTGAGVIDLFFQEVEKYKDDSAFKERVNKTIISTTIENIKEFFGNLFGGEKTEIADSNSEQIINSNSNNSNEQFNEINLFSTPLPQAEFFNEVIVNSTPFPTLSPTPLPSKTPSPSPTKTPTTTPTFSPSPLPSLTPSPTPSPSPSATFLPSSGSSSKTINFCSISNGASSSNKIIINEVAWMGTKNSSDDEWIELKNISNESINISNWQLIDKDSQIKISFPNKILAPGEFYLLERTDDNSVVGIQADVNFKGAINDANETLQLFDSNCALQDEAKTNNEGLWPAGNKEEKRSMERDTDLTWHTYNGEINNGIYGTPKQENSLKIIEPLPSETPTPTPSPSSTPLPPLIVTSSKILISEISYNAEKSDEGKEFVELYNPNETDVDLIGWSLQIVKNNSTTSSSLASINKNDFSVIKSHSFLLIGFNKYNASNYNNIEADIVRTSASLPNPKEDENVRIILVDNQQNIIDEISYQKNSCLEGKSLERKTNASSTVDSMTNGNDQFLGNSYDTNSIDDFIVRSPQPQNSLSLPEPRNKPTSPAPLSGQESIISYDASSSSLVFSWSPSIDVKGSSNEILYKIFQRKDNVFDLMISTTSTEVVVPLAQFNISFPFSNTANLEFKIIAYDRDGLASDEVIFNLVDKEGVIFSQLEDSKSSLYSHYSDNWYRLGRGFSGKLKSITLKGCSQHQGTSTITLKEFEDENYTHEIFSITILSDNSLLPISVENPPDACPKEIKINDLNIELHPYSYYRLDTYHSWQNKNVILWGTNATGTAMHNDWIYNKGRVESYYPFYPYIILEGEIGPKIDFSIPQKPMPPEIKNIQFNNLAETITFSWASSTDLDSLDDKITYEYNVTNQDDFDESNWHSTGFNLSATTTVSYPHKYKIAVRAVDDAGLKSEISQTNWEFPSDFVILQQQRQMDSKSFNPYPYITAQVFTPTQSGYVKGLKISVQSFVDRGNNKSLQAFLYDADDPKNISEKNLIDSSEISNITWGDMHHIETIFAFKKGIFLEAGHKYVWLITTHNMTVCLDGICGKSLVGGDAWARYGDNNWNSNDCWLAPANYYFVLIGSTQS